ncbi:hypothetical protein M2351_005249 [Azospirillum canadense]|nr:hypothetical protein [Azospirillum canadense]
MALGHPLQRPHGVAQRDRLDDLPQVLQQRGIAGAQRAPPTAGAPHPALGQRGSVEVLQAAADGSTRQAGCPGHCGQTTVADGPHLGRRKETSPPLIQLVAQRRVSRLDGSFVDHPAKHIGCHRAGNPSVDQLHSRAGYSCACPKAPCAPRPCCSEVNSAAGTLFPAFRLRDADGIRASEVEHVVQNADRDGDSAPRIGGTPKSLSRFGSSTTCSTSDARTPSASRNQKAGKGVPAAEFTSLQQGRVSRPESPPGGARRCQGRAGNRGAPADVGLVDPRPRLGAGLTCAADDDPLHQVNIPSARRVAGAAGLRARSQRTTAGSPWGAGARFPTCTSTRRRSATARVRWTARRRSCARASGRRGARRPRRRSAFAGCWCSEVRTDAVKPDTTFDQAMRTEFGRA